MKVTVCEMPDDRAEFEGAWTALSKHVGKQGSELVLLPEMPFYYWFCAGPKFDQRIWDDAVKQHRRWMSRLPELGVPVVLSSSPVDSGERKLNQGYVWSEKEGRKGVHYKNYLPNESGFYEARWYARGDGTFKPFEAADWKAGFMICSDLWSLASARSYGKQGVQLLAVPRATGSPDARSRWIAAGRVAATLAAAYCLSSNRAGKRGEATFGGHGWIIDPDGEVIGLTSKARPFLTADIKKAKSDSAKKTYPRDSLEPD